MGAILSILFYLYFTLFTLIYFTLFSVIFFITFPFDRDRKVMHILSRVWAKSYFSMVPRRSILVEGLEHVDPKNTYVVVVNHRSMIDILLSYMIPLDFKWVAKREVYNWPIFGWVLRMHGDITIERGTASGVKKMMKESQEWLSRGVSVVVFPEGSRREMDGVGRFKDGAFVMAQRAETALLPCVMRGTDTALTGWKINFKNTYQLKILPPVSVQEVVQTDVRTMTLLVGEMIASEYEKMGDNIVENRVTKRIKENE